MRDAIITGIVGGVFTMIGVYLKHRLERKERFSSYTINPDSQNIIYNEEENKVKKPGPIKDIVKGFFILLVNFILLAILVDVFDLNETEYDWIFIPAFLGLVIVPMYGLFRILRGIIKLMIR